MTKLCIDPWKKMSQREIGDRGDTECQNFDSFFEERETKSFL